MTVLINGVDKTSGIDWQSFQVEQQLTNQIDTVSFKILKHANKTYTPTLGDSVLISDSAVEIFGGSIVTIQNSVEAGVLTVLDINAVSHERTLDRYLAIREIINKTPRYIINTLVDEFVNKITKEIDLGESTETWVTEDGTVAANTTNGQFLQGDQSRKMTATAGSTATARRETTLDLTAFSDTSAATTADKITLWYYVDNIANFGSLRLQFVSDAGATYTNYYEYTISTTPVVGFNQAVILKSAFSAVGSPNWNDIKKRQYRVTASASGTVNVSVDDIRLVKATTAFTQQNVQDVDSQFLGSVKFNYEQITQCFVQIAEAIGCDWYVDPDRDIHFFAPLTEPASFALNDTSANFIWDSLKINTDTTTIKNTIYIRGGEYQGSATDYNQTADGNALNFRSPFRLKNIVVTVAAGAKTVGVDNLDDPTSFDCLYNFNEKTLKFKTATKPTVGQIVHMNGNPMIPVIVKKGDPTSIAANGVYEFLVIDKSIQTLQGGRDRATSELRAYRDNLVEGEFTTDTAGLRAGQTISINITARGIADDYIIKSVVFRTKSPTAFFYDVKLVSTRSFGIIEYLLNLIRNDRKQIILNDNEVIDLVQGIDELVTITDVWTQGDTNTQTETLTLGEVLNNDLDHGTIFVLGPYTPANFADTKRPFILNGSPLG